jgi:hypothetical protein
MGGHQNIPEQPEVFLECAYEDNGLIRVGKFKVKLAHELWEEGFYISSREAPVKSKVEKIFASFLNAKMITGVPEYSGIDENVLEKYIQTLEMHYLDKLKRNKQPEPKWVYAYELVKHIWQNPQFPNIDYLRRANALYIMASLWRDNKSVGYEYNALLRKPIYDVLPKKLLNMEVEDIEYIPEDSNLPSDYAERILSFREEIKSGKQDLADLILFIIRISKSLEQPGPRGSKILFSVSQPPSFGQYSASEKIKIGDELVKEFLLLNFNKKVRGLTL